MAYDDAPTDLLKTPESQTSRNQTAAFDPDLIASWNPGRREYPNVLIMTFAGFALFCAVILSLKNRPGGMPIAAMVIYTLLIPYILSNRLLSFVPWTLLKQFRQKFLLIHCLALAVIYGLTRLAVTIKPRFPDWFVTAGRRPSLFNFCLGGLILSLAFIECLWISQNKDRDTFNAEQHS